MRRMVFIAGGVVAALLGIIVVVGAIQPQTRAATPQSQPAASVVTSNGFDLSSAPLLPETYPSNQFVALLRIGIPGIETLRVVSIQLVDPTLVGLFKSAFSEVSQAKTILASHLPVLAVTTFPEAPQHPLPFIADCVLDAQDQNSVHMLLQYITSSEELREACRWELVDRDPRLLELFRANPKALQIECVQILGAKLALVDASKGTVYAWGESNSAVSAPDMLEFRITTTVEKLALMQQAFQRGSLRSIIRYDYNSRRVVSAGSNAQLAVQAKNLVSSKLDSSPTPGHLNQSQLDELKAELVALLKEDIWSLSPELTQLVSGDADKLMDLLFEVVDFNNPEEIEQYFKGIGLEDVGEGYLVPTTERTREENSASKSDSSRTANSSANSNSWGSAYEYMKSKGNGSGVIDSIFGSSNSSSEARRSYFRRSGHNASQHSGVKESSSQSTQSKVTEREGIVSTTLGVYRIRRGELNTLVSKIRTIHQGVASSTYSMTDSPINLGFTKGVLAAGLAYAEDVRGSKAAKEAAERLLERTAVELHTLRFSMPAPAADQLKVKEDLLANLKRAIAECDAYLEEAAGLPLLATARERDDYRTILREQQQCSAELAKTRAASDAMASKANKTDAEHAELSKLRATVASLEARSRDLEQRLSALKVKAVL